MNTVIVKTRLAATSENLVRESLSHVDTISAVPSSSRIMAQIAFYELGVPLRLSSRTQGFLAEDENSEHEKARRFITGLKEVTAGTSLTGSTVIQAEAMTNKKGLNPAIVGLPDGRAVHLLQEMSGVYEYVYKSQPPNHFGKIVIPLLPLIRPYQHVTLSEDAREVIASVRDAVNRVLAVSPKLYLNGISELVIPAYEVSKEKP